MAHDIIEDAVHQIVAVPVEAEENARRFGFHPQGEAWRRALGQLQVIDPDPFGVRNAVNDLGSGNYDTARLIRPGNPLVGQNSQVPSAHPDRRPCLHWQI